MRNPLSLEAFADWCEKKPADEEYYYPDPTICACGQYAKYLGMNPSEVIGFSDLNLYAALSPWTFGALAQRLREASL